MNATSPAMTSLTPYSTQPEVLDGTCRPMLTLWWCLFQLMSTHDNSSNDIQFNPRKYCVLYPYLLKLMQTILQQPWSPIWWHSAWWIQWWRPQMYCTLYIINVWHVFLACTSFCSNPDHQYDGTQPDGFDGDNILCTVLYHQVPVL